MRFYLCRSNGTVPLRKSKGDMGEYNAIEVIRKVAGKLKDKKLANLKTVETEIRELGEYLGLNAMQTVLFIAIFDRQCGDSRTDISVEAPTPTMAPKAAVSDMKGCVRARPMMASGPTP